MCMHAATLSMALALAGVWSVPCLMSLWGDNLMFCLVLMSTPRFRVAPFHFLLVVRRNRRKFLSGVSQVSTTTACCRSYALQQHPQGGGAKLSARRGWSHWGCRCGPRSSELCSCGGGGARRTLACSLHSSRLRSSSPFRCTAGLVEWRHRPGLSCPTT